MIIQKKKELENEISKVFPIDFKEINKFSDTEVIKFYNILKKYISVSEAFMKSQPFTEKDLKDLNDPEICIPLKKAIEICSNKEITDADCVYTGIGGVYHMLDTKTNIHYFGQVPFWCRDLCISAENFYILSKIEKDKEIKHLAEKLKKLTECYDLKLLGIMWYKHL